MTRQIDTDLRPAPFLIGDHLALDFLNSVAAPAGAPIDWLKSGADYVEWLERVEAITATDALASSARFSGASLDRAAGEARALRETWRACVARFSQKGRAPTAAEIDGLSAVLARMSASFQIVAAAGSRRLFLKELRRFDNAGALIATIAFAMAELFCDGEPGLIRRCENPACTLWFYDRTKAHGRRWCSQAVCGNRAKAAAFRQRRRARQSS